MGLTISLLHATYRSRVPAAEIRRRWIESASSPQLVEHIFALDEDDELSVRATQGYRRVVNPASPARVSAVRNWNSAAASCTGDLLFVIADDLAPPMNWDATLRNVAGSLDPRRFPFAIGVGHERGPKHMLHPIVSWCFYSRFGLFAPDFTGVYCDDDITIRAYNEAVVLDGQELLVEHSHPTTGPHDWSESHARLNKPAEYEVGLRILRDRWSTRLRATRREFFSPPPGVPVPAVRAAAWRARLKLFGLVTAILGRETYGHK